MSDYYDKLGDLLKESIENGSLEQEINNVQESKIKKETAVQIDEINNEQKENVQLPHFKNFKDKQNYFNALNKFGLKKICPFEDINKRYKELIKAVHPDTATENNSVDSAEKINALQNNLKYLKGFYDKKN